MKKTGLDFFCIIVLLFSVVCAHATNRYIVPGTVAGVSGVTPTSVKVSTTSFADAQALGADSYASLTDAFADFSNGDNVYVLQGTYYITAQLAPKRSTKMYGGFRYPATTMSERLTSGNGFNGKYNFNYPSVIDGGGVTRCLQGSNQAVNNAQMVIDGFTFQNGKFEGSGGGLTIYRNTKLIRCKVLNCISTGTHAGGIYSSGSTAYAEFPVFDSCYIYNNSVQPVPATYMVKNYKLTVSGGGIYVVHTADILNTTIEHNYIDLETAQTYCHMRGAGVFLDPSANTTLHVDNCLFDGNYLRLINAPEDGPGAYASAYGGGLYAGGANALQLTNSTFQNNSIYVFADARNALYENSNDTASAYGAAVYKSSSIIYPESGAVLTNVRVLNNSINADGIPAPMGSNYTWAYGGGLHITDGLTMTDCLVQGNSALSHRASIGAGLYLSAAVYQNGLSISNSSFLKNRCVSDSTSYGGGLNVSNHYGSTVLTNLTVEHNLVQSINAKFSDGSSGTSGGGMHCYCIDTVPAIQIIGGSFSHNKVLGHLEKGTASGGGIFAEKAIVLKGVTIKRDTLQAFYCRGAGILNTSGFSMTLDDCVIGGDTYADGNIIHNSGYGRGGGVCQNSGSFYATNTKIRFNHIVNVDSTARAGGLYTVPNGFVSNEQKLTNCIISDNSVSAGKGVEGGGWESTGHNHVLKNVTIERDSLYSERGACLGGGAYIAGAVSADNVVVCNNYIAGGSESTYGYAGGVYSSLTRTLYRGVYKYFYEQNWRNCQFNNNTIEDGFHLNVRGAAGQFLANRLLSKEITPVINIYDSEIAGNRILNTQSGCTSYGGGLYVLAYGNYLPENTDSLSYLNIKRCLFHDNVINGGTSTIAGSALFSENPFPSYTVENCMFFNNSGSTYAVSIGVRSVCNNTLFNNKSTDHTSTNVYLRVTGYRALAKPPYIVANNIVWGPAAGNLSISSNTTLTDLPVHHNYVTGNLPSASNFNTSLGNTNTAYSASDVFRASDPNHRDYSDEDEFLLPKSGGPLVGTGYTVASVTNDYLGNTRTAPYDIGALKYLPEANLTVNLNCNAGSVTIRDKSDVLKGTATYASAFVEGISPIKTRKLQAQISNPNDGYFFSSWSNGSKDNPMRIMFSEEVTYTAVFKQIIDTVIVAYKDTNAYGDYPDVTIYAKNNEYRGVITFKADDIRKAYNDTTGYDYPEDGLFKAATGDIINYQKPACLVKEISIRNVADNADSVARVCLCVAPAYYHDETHSPKDTINNTVYDYHGIKQYNDWSGLDLSCNKEWRVTATLTSSLGADSTYESTRILHLGAFGDAPMHIVSWLPNPLKRTVDLTLSLWGQNLNGEEENAYGALFYVNGSDTPAEILYNGDRTVTLNLSSNEVKPGKNMLRIGLRDGGTVGNPVRSVQYYDVPVFLSNKTYYSVPEANAETDLWIYNTGGVEQVTSMQEVYFQCDVEARNVYVMPGTTLGLSSSGGAHTLTIHDSLYLYAGIKGNPAQIYIPSVNSRIVLPDKAGAVNYVCRVDNSKWTMLSLPFACDFDKIRKSNEKGDGTGTVPTNYHTKPVGKKAPELLIKAYNSRRRAQTYQSEADATAAGRWWWAGTKENPGPLQYIWDTVPYNGTIPANTGFEMATNTPYYREFIFPSKTTPDSIVFRTNQTVPVKYYNDGQNTWDIHYGWNLIGIPSLIKKYTFMNISLDDPSDSELNRWGVYAYDPNTRVWKDYNSENVEMRPFNAYLVQVRDDSETDGADHTLYFSGASGTYRQTVFSAPAKDRSSNRKPISFALLLGDPDGYDKTEFHIHDSYTTDYEIGFDRLKILTGDALVPQFYSIAPKGDMSHNALPDSAAMQPIPLGFTLPEPGHSTIQLFGLRDDAVEAVYLHDSQENVTVNLIDGQYDFYSSRTSDYTRFSLQLVIDGSAHTPTGEEELMQTASGIRVTSNGTGVMLSGTGNATVTAFDAVGRLVAKVASVGGDAVVPLPSDGVFMLVVNGEDGTETLKVAFTK